MTLINTIVGAVLGLAIFAATLHACTGPTPPPAPICKEGVQELHFECLDHTGYYCRQYAERWYVCKKGEWVQE